ncbi:hypothetical protein CHU98_g5234 [Xylaria longipes]|nr:hypothetical protein CHU98_g5234 [Xylaria longipes]
MHTTLRYRPRSQADKAVALCGHNISTGLAAYEYYNVIDWNWDSTEYCTNSLKERTIFASENSRPQRRSGTKQSLQQKPRTRAESGRPNAAQAVG